MSKSFILVFTLLLCLSLMSCDLSARTCREGADVSACSAEAPSDSQDLTQPWAVSIDSQEGTPSVVSMQEMGDGGLVLVGYIDQTADEKTFCQNDQPWILRLDPDGNREWGKLFKMVCSGRFNSIQNTSDGGLIIGGFTEQPAYAWILKIDREGNLEWEKLYDGLLTAYSIQETIDRGYILLGNMSSEMMPFSTVILKLDREGNILWQRTYRSGGKGYDDYARGIQPTSDNGYIVMGFTGFYTDEENYLWALKTTGDGDFQWSRSFSTSDGTFIFPTSIQPTSDNGFVLSGYSQSWSLVDPQKNWTRPWIMKLKSNGSLAWQKTYQDEESDRAVTGTISVAPNGDLVMSGFREGQMWILKTNENGCILWQNAFRSDDFEWELGGIAVNTSDGGLAAAGSTTKSLWVYKIDGNGRIPGCKLCDETMLKPQPSTIAYAKWDNKPVENFKLVRAEIPELSPYDLEDMDFEVDVDRMCTE